MQKLLLLVLVVAIVLQLVAAAPTKHKEHKHKHKAAHHKAHKATPTAHPKHKATTKPKHKATTTTKHKTTPKPTNGGSKGSSDQQTILAVHNKYRAIHQAPPLKWDNTLANYASNYIGHCQFKHSGGPYGENLAMGYGDWTSVVNAWYDEVKDYSYSNPGFSMATGHFTQVVWKGSTKIGCGFASCNGQKMYSCNYDPPGNYLGEFPQNVLPPK
ncbi:CAP domain-containing protein [Gongronella butleri]|nr:CAP domain-containing protein [Gongronella butleri]